MAITTILLDGGGVILDEADTEHANAEIITEIIQQCGIPYSIDEYWRDTEEAVYRFVPSTYRYILWKKLQSRDKFEEAHRKWRYRLATDGPPLRIADGMAEQLRTLSHHFKFGLAGQYGAEILDTLMAGSLLDLFDYKGTQDNFSITKPDPRYFEQIAAACGVTTQSCLMVGDRIDNDIIPAHQTGMLAVRIRTGIHIRQEPRTPPEFPDAEIDSVSQLAQTILRLTSRS
ncbi:MAG: HAD family hydrolase [Candidatus Zixiibacteriota bacterium]